jgi:cyclophilin family peptidyl-prolyl cis-trans isomerase
MEFFYMLRHLLIILLILIMPVIAFAADKEKSKGNIIMETTLGTIKVELFDDKAPLTCANFRRYVNEEFFNGLVFHRIIPGFVIQGGGFAPGMKKRKTHPAIVNEANNGLKNKRGTLSMARTQDIYSATSQFFINVADNTSLDHSSKSFSGFGYAVYGKVISGMNVVDRIVASPKGTSGQYQDVPKTDIIMLKVFEEK